MQGKAHCGLEVLARVVGTSLGSECDMSTWSGILLRLSASIVHWPVSPPGGPSRPLPQVITLQASLLIF